MNPWKRRLVIVAGGAALLFGIATLWFQTRQVAKQAAPPPVASGTESPASVPASVEPPDPDSRAAIRAKIIGITNFAALTPAQVREFERVVSPGVSNFIALLQRHSVSPFDPQPIGAESFLSLHDPKPGNIWDLKLRSNNGHDYFLRFNQTREMGHIAGLTNVVSFFPINKPSLQDVMDAFPSEGRQSGSTVKVQPRLEETREAAARNVSQEIFSDLGQPPDGFIRVATTTERASGIAGGHMIAYRPKGLAQPDNALYDTTFGFAERGKGLVLDTFTHNSARLVPPHRQQTPPVRLAAPRF